MSSRSSRVVVEYRGKRYPGLYERNGVFYRRLYIDGNEHWQRLRAASVIDAIAEWKRLQDEENPVAPNRIKVRELWEMVAAERREKGKWKRSTYEKTHEPRWRLNIEPVIGHLPVQAVTARDINKVYKRMDTEPFTTKDGRTGMYSSSCKTHTRNLLKTLFDAAMREGYGPIRNSTPMAGADHPEAVKVNAVFAEDVLDQGEVEAILAELRRYSERNYLIVRLAASTGMRTSEVLGLVWGDIDLDKGEIKIRRQLAYDAKAGRSVEENRDLLKMERAAGGRAQSKSRVAYLMEQTVAELREHRRAGLRNGAFPHGEQFVFCTSTLSPIAPRSLATVLKAAAARCPSITKPVHMHAFRHAYASWQFAGSADDNAVSHDLGHTSTDFTRKRYIHVKEDAEAARKARERHAAAGIR